MPYTTCRLLTFTLVLFTTATATRSEEPTIAGPTIADKSQPLRIGAVAYAPNVVTVFQGLTSYLRNQGLDADYVLFSNYDALVSALHRREVDIAWNTPLAHGQYHLLQKCSSQTLVMRDVDVGVHAILIARSDSGISALSDLVDKRLIFGSRQAAEATLLPLHFLKLQGIDLKSSTIISLDEEVDSAGNPCASPHHVLAAVRAGRGDAGIISDGLWRQIQTSGDTKSEFHCVWVSPAFSHCVFTAAADLDRTAARRFTELMTAMTPNDPQTRDVMRFEGTKRWLAGSPEGFECLVDALRESESQGDK